VVVGLQDFPAFPFVSRNGVIKFALQLSLQYPAIVFLLTELLVAQ
jgi:hypothetical protein